MDVRLAKISDLEEILSVLDAAREIMRFSGNSGQWVNGYPSKEVILRDIAQGVGYVLEQEGLTAGYFAFIPSPEPTYALIEGGNWLDASGSYHVIHLIGSLPQVHGVFNSIMDFAFSQDRNIRIDTHRDNLIMQHNLAKHGFVCCGIIYLESGDERLAYQKILP